MVFWFLFFVFLKQKSVLPAFPPGVVHYPQRERKASASVLGLLLPSSLVLTEKVSLAGFSMYVCDSVSSLGPNDVCLLVL